MMCEAQRILMASKPAKNAAYHQRIPTIVNGKFHAIVSGIWSAELETPLLS
jgi:hypothetical protein